MSGDLVVGIDLGGTRVRVAVLKRNGELLARAEELTRASDGICAVVDQIADLYDRLTTDISRNDIRGAGICAPGPLDTRSGVSLNDNTILGYQGYPLRDTLAARLGLPVVVENDAIAAMLGEWHFGAGQGKQNFIYVTVSTGIGGGALINGAPMRGTRGLAAHFGHMMIDPAGPVCFCGNRGCWEAVGSGSALSATADQNGFEDAPRLFEAALAGDETAGKIVSDYSDILGVGIVNLLHVFNPEAVVVGGGVSKSFHQLLPGIAARVQKSAMLPFRDCPIVPAQQPDNGGLLGAATLVP